mmetsp:Transcript_18688/g.43369  ORF Transcript_18688/g.43369 Transcript_18688/m.43369 type:complete len:212 (-) Transcript_18688:1288-1923(-)
MLARTFKLPIRVGSDIYHMGLGWHVGSQVGGWLFRPRGINTCARQYGDTVTRHKAGDIQRGRKQWARGRFLVCERQGRKRIGPTRGEETCSARGAAWLGPLERFIDGFGRRLVQTIQGPILDIIPFRKPQIRLVHMESTSHGPLDGRFLRVLWDHHLLDRFARSRFQRNEVIRESQVIHTHNRSIGFYQVIGCESQTNVSRDVPVALGIHP